MNRWIITSTTFSDGILNALLSFSSEFFKVLCPYGRLIEQRLTNLCLSFGPLTFDSIPIVHVPWWHWRHFNWHTLEAPRTSTLHQSLPLAFITELKTFTVIAFPFLSFVIISTSVFSFRLKSAFPSNCLRYVTRYTFQIFYGNKFNQIICEFDLFKDEKYENSITQHYDDVCTL